jgi:hypothetical protein
MLGEDEAAHPNDEAEAYVVLYLSKPVLWHGYSCAPGRGCCAIHFSIETAMLMTTMSAPCLNVIPAAKEPSEAATPLIPAFSAPFNQAFMEPSSVKAK